MNFIAVNRFELPNDNKIKTIQFAGYITRDSDVYVKFKSLLRYGSKSKS